MSQNLFFLLRYFSSVLFFFSSFRLSRSLLVVFTILLLSYHAHSLQATPYRERPFVEEWINGARGTSRAGVRRGRRATRFAGGHVSPRDRPIIARADVSSLTKDVSINEAWVEVGSGVGAD